MCHYKILYLIIVLVISVFGQYDFPLLKSGRMFLFAKGNNDRCYTSASPLRPTHVGLLEFMGSGTIKYSWANCNHHDYASTIELVDEIMKSLSKQKEIGIEYLNQKESPVYIVKTTTKDTLWSIDEALINANSMYYKVVRSYESVEDVFEGASGRTLLKNNPKQYIVKPLGYGVRKRTIQDNNRYIVKTTDTKTTKEIYVKGIKDSPDTYGNITDEEIDTYIDDEAPFLDHCDKTDCYEWIPGEKGTPSNIPYWQLHFKPEIYLYPIDYTNGTPLLYDELKMDYITAVANREKSIKEPSNQNMMKYRKPYYSDSASTVISIAFVGDQEIRDQEFVYLSASEMGVNALYDHFPNRAYIAKDWQGVYKNLLKLYANDDRERILQETMATRCSGWPIEDTKIGNVLFPKNNRTSGIYQKDESIDEEIFIYNNCPHYYKDDLFGMTPKQARRFIRMSVPSCGLDQMYKAKNFYSKAQKYFAAAEDENLLKERIRRADLLIELKKDELQKLNVTDEQRISAEKNCPKTWVDFISGL